MEQRKNDSGAQSVMDKLTGGFVERCELDMRGSLGGLDTMQVSSVSWKNVVICCFVTVLYTWRTADGLRWCAFLPSSARSAQQVAGLGIKRVTECWRSGDRLCW